MSNNAAVRVVVTCKGDRSGTPEHEARSLLTYFTELGIEATIQDKEPLMVALTEADADALYSATTTGDATSSGMLALAQKVADADTRSTSKLSPTRP